MLPIIPISALQRSSKDVLAKVRDYAVVQSHGRDRAFVLHPALGRILLQSGMLEELRRLWKAEEPSPHDGEMERRLQGLIGNVLRELSKR
jgi:hypothetical protein